MQLIREAGGGALPLLDDGLQFQVRSSCMLRSVSGAAARGGGGGGGGGAKGASAPPKNI